ncbi:LacI family DNA-binding transcriptional regulator, partial [Kibdelosporangium lantanae]
MSRTGSTQLRRAKITSGTEARKVPRHIIDGLSNRLAGGRVNIGEIAKRAGVSRSTVSYALSGKRPVSAATVRRINDVIAE